MTTWDEVKHLMCGLRPQYFSVELRRGVRKVAGLYVVVFS